MAKNKLVAPVVKWVGGKRQLLDEITPLLPKRIASYCEPFLGGGAVLFSIQPLNSNSGLEFNVVEFTKEHSNILAGAVILVLAGALVVNAIPSIIALFSAGAGTVFGLLIQAL